MVSKEYIELIIEKSILEVTKCGNDYPKARALRYWQEHKDEFETEDYNGKDNRVLPSPVGVLQRVQEKLQENVEYTGIEKGVAHDYSTNSYIPLGLYLNNVPNWEQKAREWVIAYDFGQGFVMAVIDFDISEANKNRSADESVSPYVDLSMPEESEILSRMIDKSPRVQFDTTVYRYGELPLDIGVGEHGTIKSFMSTSYNPYIAFEDIPEGGTWAKVEADKRYKTTVHVMGGTKGMVLNKHTGCANWQSELLLDKGMRYVVLDKNDEEMTAEILVY